MFSGQLANAAMTNFQRSQDTLYALAKDTGGKAMFDYNDLSLGIVQAAEAVTQLLHHRATTARIRRSDGRFHRVRMSLNGGVRRRSSPYRQGYFADKEFGEVHGRRQGAPARGGADAGKPGHRDHDCDGGELLPAESALSTSCRWR